MADYIRRGTCGACKDFDFEGNNKKGYCRRYGQYYWDDDSCSKYDEDDSRLSSSGGSTCFLTSACCRYKGLPDDCVELSALRTFRDTYLRATPEGNALIDEYYRIAPALVEKIESSRHRDEILSDIYNEICQIVGMLNQKNHEKAVEAYKAMVLNVQKRVDKGE